MVAHARRAASQRALSHRNRRRAIDHPSALLGQRVRRHGGRPVRRDAEAVGERAARHERVGASVRLWPAVPAAPLAQRARALRKEPARLAVPAGRHRRSLLYPGRAHHMTRTTLLLALLAVLGAASAQDYPARPIRVVVPYSAGGSSD